MKLVGRVPLASLETQSFVRLDYPPWHVLVALVQGVACAIEDSCNHAGASLAEGARTGDRVICPLHGYVFSLDQGVLIAPRGLCPNQRTFETTVEGNEVLVWDPFALEIVAP